MKSLCFDFGCIEGISMRSVFDAFQEGKQQAQEWKLQQDQTQNLINVFHDFLIISGNSLSLFMYVNKNSIVLGSEGYPDPK